MDRRQVLAGLAAGAAAAALPNVVQGQAPDPAGCGLAPDYFPNVAVLTHTGRRARFHEDLLRDRIVLIHFLSDVGAEHGTVSENLARAQALLGDRMGKDVFFYSIATDAERDTPRRLAELAERHGAGPGWLFLTAEPGDLETLKSRFFVHDAGHSKAHAANHHAAPVQDCARGLLRYGNTALNLWGSVPAQADPRWIAERLFWVQPSRPDPGAEAPAPRRRGPLPRVTALLVSLGLLAATATAQAPKGVATATTPETAAAPVAPACQPASPPAGDPYQHPHPQAAMSPSTLTCDDNVFHLCTGTSLFAPSEPFVDPPGTNFLPTVYTDLYDAAGNQIPNTLPSTPTIPYNLLDGEPVVSRINPTSPTNDLRTIFDLMLRAPQLADEPDRDSVRRTIQRGIDILEGNPIPDRVYSGLPVLHYKGPEKLKQVVPIKDANGTVVGGNVDVHQVWFDSRIENDTYMIDPTTVPNVPWTITYTVDVLDRGEDDFSPFVMYLDSSTPPSTGGAPMARPWVAMDQTFFPMQDGTRTIFKVKMAPGQNYNLVYTWGWRVHPPRAQVMEKATKPVTAFTNPCDASTSVTKTIQEWEESVFGKAPTSSEEAKLAAIAKIGDIAPEKQMWRALRQAREAAQEGKWEAVREQARKGKAAYFDWLDRTQLPGDLEPDPDSDITLLYANNTIYGEFTAGTTVNLPPYQTRGYTVRITLLNGDNFEHGYQNVDFGGGRGWENQFKSSVKVAGSGCWFTFGRVYWSMLVPSVPLLPPAQGMTPSKQKMTITFNFDPSRRLRFYQFDPLHHDVAIFSVH